MKERCREREKETKGEGRGEKMMRGGGEER